MMLLAIDIGNTNTVFACFEGGALVKSWRCQTRAGRCADEYAAFIQAQFTLCDIPFTKIKDIIISSVVPDADFSIVKFCKDYFAIMPYKVHRGLVNLTLRIDKPDELGADRLVNARAVQDYGRLPAIVVDFGTATTFDVINEAGAYTGGVIAPGINLSLDALERAAAKLPRVSIKPTSRYTCTDTISAIQAGIFWGYIGLIEKIIGGITEELGKKPFVIATGGLSSLFANHTPCIETVDEDLTLKGLLRIHEDIKACENNQGAQEAVC